MSPQNPLSDIAELFGKEGPVRKDLNNLSVTERQQIHQACLPIVEHNYNHFYRGALSDLLWTELNQMLNEFTNQKGSQ